MYRIIRLFRSDKSPLYTAALLTFSLLHIQVSQFARAWTLVITFDLLTILLLLQVVKKRTPHLVVRASLSAALAYGSHHSGVIAYIAILWFALISYSSFSSLRKWLVFWGRGVPILIVAPLFFSSLQLDFAAIGHPEHLNLLLRYPPQIGPFIATVGNHSALFVKALISYEPAITLLSIVGFFIPSQSQGHRRLKSLAIVIAFTTAVFFYPTARSLLPLVVLLSLVAGPVIPQIAVSLKIKPTYVAGLILLPGFFYVARFDWLLHQKTTFNEASQWLITQPPVFTAIRDSNFFTFIPSATASSAIREKQPLYYSSAYENLPDSATSSVIYLNHLLPLGTTEAEYIAHAIPPRVVDVYFDPKDKLSLPTFYRSVAHFYPRNDNTIRLTYFLDSMISPYPPQALFAINRPGPYIDIFVLKRTEP